MPRSPEIEDRETMVKVFSYRNIFYLFVTVCASLSVPLVFGIIFNLATGELPKTSPSLQGDHTFNLVLTWIGFLLFFPAFSAFLVFHSLPFGRERIVIDHGRLTWIDRWGRVRCDTQLSKVRVLEDSPRFCLSPGAIVVHTDDGDIYFHRHISRYKELLEILRFPR